jgi:hypothetical protein
LQQDCHLREVSPSTNHLGTSLCPLKRRMKYGACRMMAMPVKLQGTVPLVRLMAPARPLCSPSRLDWHLIRRGAICLLLSKQETACGAFRSRPWMCQLWLASQDRRCLRWMESVLMPHSSNRQMLLWTKTSPMSSRMGVVLLLARDMFAKCTLARCAP